MVRCCLCQCDAGKYGNNALPVKKGRCCDECNVTKVIPARMLNAREGKELCKLRKK